MSADLKLSFSRPLRGLRPHGTAGEEVPAPCGTGKWLFDLREKTRAAAQRQEAFEACVVGIDQAVAALTASVGQRLDEVAAQATELGLALAAEVLGVAIDKGLADPTPTVVRCLRETVAGSEGGEVEVFLAADDLGPVLDGLDAHPDLRERVGRVQFHADPDLSRGAVRIESAFGRLVYDPAEVLQRISDEVRRELAE